MATYRRIFNFAIIALSLAAAWLIRSSLKNRKIEKAKAYLEVDLAIFDPGRHAQEPTMSSYDELESHNGPYPRFKLVAELGRNQLACWPSTGGFWVARDVHPIMLKHIGVDRFLDSWKSDSPAEEDELCKQMEVLGFGSTYYSSADAYVADLNGWWIGVEGESRESYGIVDRPAILKCRLQSGEGWMLENNEPTTHFRNQMRNAISMEDLCDLIKDHGGKHFSDATQASEIQQHLGKLPEPTG